MSKETELCFYAECTNPRGYEQALSKEWQEQWEKRVEEDGQYRGKQRVRKSTKDEVNYIYEVTIKIPTAGDGVAFANEEPTVPVNEAFYEAWKRLYGELGSVKIRYVFLSQNVEVEIRGQSIQLPEIQYEVDVLVNEQGQRSKWVKIDIEIDKVMDFLKERFPDIGPLDTTVKLSSLPLGLEGAFPGNTEDPEQKAVIQRFWEGFGHRLKAA